MSVNNELMSSMQALAEFMMLFLQIRSTLKCLVTSLLLAMCLMEAPLRDKLMVTISKSWVKSIVSKTTPASPSCSTFARR